MFSDSLHAMSVPALVEGCMRELHKHKCGEPSNDQYGLELFHRALMQRNSSAWEAVQQCFNESMRRWMHSHPLRDVACRFESEENYVAQGFTRFWQATAAKQDVTFQTLGAALKYLRASLHAVIIDTLRTYARARVVALPTSAEAGEPVCEDHYDSDELWQIISHLLPDKRERRVTFLLYHCGLKPREIVHFCCQEFDDVQEIYRIRRNIIDRLRRNADYLRRRLDYDLTGE